MTTRNRELAGIIDDSGNIIAGGNLTVSGTTTTVSSTVETHADPLIELNTGAGSNSNDLGFVFERGSTGDNACLIWDESNDVFAVGTTTATGTSTGNMSFTAAGLTAAVGTFSSLDISGNADIDGTLEADVITVDGTALNEYIADTVGAMVGSNTETNIAVTYEDGDNTLDFVIGTLNQDTTGTADNITITANNSTDETVYPIFVDGTSGSQGAESDSGLTYNPSSGLLTIAGELDAGSLDISGNADIDGTLETDNLTVGGAQGSDGQVLTSTGSGVAWEDAGGGAVSAINNATANELVTIGSTTTELDAEAKLVFDGEFLGVAVTPEANWANDANGIQFAGLGGLWGKSNQAASSAVNLTYNVYDHSSTGQAYIVTDEASMYQQDDGGHIFYTAASGSADAAISWGTAKLAIKQTGAVGINILSPDYKLQVNGTGTTMNDGTGACIMVNTLDNSTSMIMLGCAADPNAAGIGYSRSASRMWLTAGGGSENNSSAAFVLNGSGQVGIGKLPETEWDSAWNVLQVGAGAMAATTDHGQMSWSQNGKARGASSNSSWERIETGAASQYVQDAGNHYFKYTTSASADVGITWTQCFTLNTSGRQTFNSSSTANAHATYCGEVGSGFKAIAFERTNGGGEVGTVVANASSTSYNTSSDYRLKENVDYTWDATTRLKQLKPARFNWIADDTNTLLEGFLAHEVSSIVPEAVSGEKDATDDDGNPDHQGIDQSKIVPLLVKTIQELEARITTLEG